MSKMPSKTAVAKSEARQFRDYLISVSACGDARIWARGKTARQSWDECERADWLLWWAAKAKVDRKILVRCACQCARRALRFVRPGELRPLKAIETAEAWCEGKATIEQVRDAASHAADAASHAAAAADAAADAACYAAADADAASYAYAYADAAAAAAVAADAACYAYAYADAAAVAADAASYAAAADAAAAAAARHSEHLAMCAIVREMIPFPGCGNGK